MTKVVMKRIIFIPIFFLAQIVIYFLAKNSGIWGELASLLRPVLYFLVGMAFACKAESGSGIKRFSVLLVAYSIIYFSPVIVEYYDFPRQIQKYLQKTEQKTITYEKASDLADDLWIKNTGKAGFVGFFKHKMAKPLPAESFFDYVEAQFDGVEELSDFIGVGINIGINTIPYTAYMLLNGVLNLNVGGGLINFIYWFLFNGLIALIGWFIGTATSE